MKGDMKGGASQFKSFINSSVSVLPRMSPILYIVGVSLGIGVFLFSMFWYMTAVNSNSFGHLKNIDLSETAQSAYYKELLNETPLTIKPQK